MATAREDHEFREVWSHNLKEEMLKISEVARKYPYVAMDTEFPGVITRPVQFSSDYHYRLLKLNVDALKIIQLGITFCDEQGQIAKDVPTWQFNFKFDLRVEMFAQNSIDLLTHSGIDFNELEMKGIAVRDFAELFMVSGLVLNKDICWLSFHSGYDFGYLLKVLTYKDPPLKNVLPETESGFFELLKTYFPNIYDIKEMIQEAEEVDGRLGLNDLSSFLEVERIGPMHQAGSDSLLTAAAFFSLQEKHFSGKLEEKYVGKLFNLGGKAADSGRLGR